jgi:hypothetical protein
MKVWDKMVILRPNDGSNDAIEIKDSKEAARVLLTAWPAAHGKSYRRAVMSCSAAVDGRVPQDAAQWAFIVAVMEAAIPYELIDRLDAEIGAVCLKLLEEDAPVIAMTGTIEKDVRPPTFWWPKQGGHARERPMRAIPESTTSQASR